jgi:hypothetical protein
MAIYQPELVLSKTDREALVLLGQLALASESDGGANLVRDAVALSPSEATRLLQLLEEFANSRLFIEGSYFAEGIGNGKADTDDRLKGIYLSWRSRRGFTNVMSGQRWREFVLRAGFNSSENAWMWPHDLQRSPIRPMKLEHFLQMEARLAKVAGLHPRVQRLIVEFVENRLQRLKALRDQQTTVNSGSLRASVEEFSRDLSDHVRGKERRPMTRKRIIAISTIMMDTATLFATRDWTAAGVLSGLAAVAPEAAGYSAGD